MASWDVIVIGLGGVGSAATYHLAAAGLRVLGIDQYAPAHDRGSSHGKTRIIRQAYFEHPAYVPLLRRAYELWDQAEQQANVQLFQRTGLVEIGPPDGVVIPGVLRSADQYDLEIERLTIHEVGRRWPGIAGESNWHAVVERNAGFLRVEECVRAHLQLALQSGASCLHGVTVQDWSVEGRGVAVVTDSGTEYAQHLVVAGGPWSGEILAELALNLQVLRKHQYWYRPDHSGMEVEEGFPCFFHETSSGYYYGFPSIANSGVKVARHSGGQPIDAPQRVHPSDPNDRSSVEQYIASYLPGLGNQFIAESGCYYTSTPDEHFVVDRHPQRSQVTVIAGLSGHGFKFASVLGEIASQLATGAATSCDISLFRIGRLIA